MELILNATGQAYLQAILEADTDSELDSDFYYQRHTSVYVTGDNMRDKSLIIENVKKWPRHSGKIDYLNFLEGKRITRNQAIKAKCYECVGGENTSPCTILACPLTIYSPFNRRKHIMT